MTRMLFVWVLMLTSAFLLSCGETEEPEPEATPAVSKFSVSVDNETKTVTLTNESLNAVSYAWDFGDGNTSTDESPGTHTYDDYGAYTIVLTVENTDGVEDSSEKAVTLEKGALTTMDILSGESSKTWVLAPMLHGYRFGAIEDPASVWWGTDPAIAESRACMFNNEFTFTSDGNYTRNFNGNFWQEYLYFNSCGEESAEGCIDLTSETTLENKLGADVTAWLETDFTYSIDGDELTVDGEGGYVGHYTSGRNTRDFGLVSEYKYTIVSISADTLVISGLGNTGDSNEDPTCLGYEAGGLDTEGEAHALFTMTLVPKSN